MFILQSSGEASEGTEQLAVGLPPANGQWFGEEPSYNEQALRQAQGERCEGQNTIRSLIECDR
jgi:hypothetical protein